MITGFKDKSHSLDTKAIPASVQNIGKYRLGLDVISNSLFYRVGSDFPNNGSTSFVLQAPSHAAKEGDVIQFLLGNLTNEWAFVQSTTTNTITLSQKLSEAPSTLDQFDILRLIPQRGSSTGSTSVITTSATFADGVPNFATVGVASGNVFTVIGTVHRMVITNTSANIISLGFNATAVLNSGVTLTGRGSSYVHDIPFSGSFNAIASAAGSNLAYNLWS